ncbi:MAG: anaerobic ribonucleoside-triphosphate reductase activating protein [Bacillota bacterium]|nr:anaerobic ribonucleoside-triphosphate reductase activating protein [Bacillota bacterium]
MKENDLLMDISILYRSTQKFYDAQLKEYHLSYAQLPVLIMIYENEGIPLNEIVSKGDYDKGTISKTVKNLESLNYIRVESSLVDKRAKALYTTEKTKQIMTDIYAIRRRWWKHLTSHMDPEKLPAFFEETHTMAEVSKKITSKSETGVYFLEWKKMSLSSYEGYISSVFYTGGCNFRCPMCTKKKFVFLKDTDNEIPNEEIREFLKNKKDMVDAICIEGGEPFMHTHFLGLLREMKKQAYKIKVMTNGSYYEPLKRAIEEGLVDMVSMRLQNSMKNYVTNIGMPDFNIENVKKSVSYLLAGHVDYEFRITLVKEFHTIQSVEQMANWIQGAKSVLLYNHENDADSIVSGLHGVEKEELFKMKAIIASKVERVKVCYKS